MDKTETITQGPFPAGTIWQWQFTITDDCGGRSTVTKNDVVQTPNDPSMPCCLPGYFADQTKAHGDCVAGNDGIVHNVCKHLALEATMALNATSNNVDHDATLV